jgi:GxxExxY protein
MKLNDITYKIRGAIFNVYNELGPGLLENIYEQALFVELGLSGLNVQSQVPIDVIYKGSNLGLGYRMDLLVEDLVVVELKSVEILTIIHLKQLQTYLKITGKPLGILVNFNTTDLKGNIKRIVNGNIEDI